MKFTLISHALCPYVQRAVIALNERGIAFERIDIDLANKPEWFLALSPLGKTPVLLADGQPIFESAVICEYLEETLPTALHPADPLQRARHRGWIEFGSTTLNGVWAFYTARDDAAFAASAQNLRQSFEQLEKALGEGPYFNGRNFSLVDAVFGPVFRYFDVFDRASGIDLFSTTPKVRAWRAALNGHRSVQTAVSGDYPERLAQFVIDQGGILGRHLARRTAINA